MKKLIIFLLVTALFIPFVSCGKNIPLTSPDPSETKTDSVLQKSCKEIIEYVYENIEETEYLKNIRGSLVFSEVNQENKEYYLGKQDVPFAQGSASEGQIQPLTYSFCVVRIKSGEDSAKAEKTIRDNADPSKWVCMSAETVYVERIDDVVSIIMANKETADILRNAFLSLKE